MNDNGDETMTRTTTHAGGRNGSPWRIAGWTAAALLLLAPLVAMQFTDEVVWTVGDFVVAGLLLLGVGVPLELAVRKTGDPAYRIAVGVALAAAFLLVWISLAVGIIGSEADPANGVYAGVLAIGVVGALVARFRPSGMARAMLATSLALVAVAVIAVAAGWGATGPIWPWEVVTLNGFFAALFAGSALLFRHAGRARPSGGAGPGA